MRRTKSYFSIIGLTLFISVSNSWANNQKSHNSEQHKYITGQVCESQVPASVGGPVAHSNILTLRWLGEANVELTYNNQIIVLSTYFDVGPREEQVIDPDDIVQADWIFLGHGHGDHMSDAAQVATQTGATVFGDP